MPVGNASDGIGLFAGQIMLAANLNSQYIDWSHGPTQDEDFNHWGHLSSTILVPSITLGLSDYWNVNYSQIFAIRKMGWGPHLDSNHHRDESSLDDFINAKGGALGDGKLKFQYLLNNAGMQTGNRTFLGFGVIIPSDNVLTSSPFFDEEEDVKPHRHFALSDGNYKGLIELQYFNKTNYNPVFWGIKTELGVPFADSDYGYKAGKNYNINISTLFKLNSNSVFLPIGLSIGFTYLHTEKGYWGNQLDPASESTIAIPSIGGIWKLGKGGVSISLQKPLLLEGIGMAENNTLNNDFDAFELMIGYRYTLDYVIPWLYF